MAGWTLPLLSIIFTSLRIGFTLGDGSPAATHLHVNALVGINGASAVQCWSVDPPFAISTQAGTVGARIQSIGNSTGSTVVFFNETGDTNAGLHGAPAPQWVMVLAGRGLVTLPATNATLALPAGTIIIADDTADVSDIGHNTEWAAGSVAMQLPFENRVLPAHTVINSGPCKDSHHGGYKL